MPICKEKCILNHRITPQNSELDSQIIIPSLQRARHPRGPMTRAFLPFVCSFLASVFLLSLVVHLQCRVITVPTAALFLNNKNYWKMPS